MESDGSVSAPGLLHDVSTCHDAPNQPAVTITAPSPFPSSVGGSRVVQPQTEAAPSASLSVNKVQSSVKRKRSPDLMSQLLDRRSNTPTEEGEIEEPDPRDRAKRQKPLRVRWRPEETLVAIRYIEKTAEEEDANRDGLSHLEEGETLKKKKARPLLEWYPPLLLQIPVEYIERTLEIMREGSPLDIDSRESSVASPVEIRREVTDCDDLLEQTAEIPWPDLDYLIGYSQSPLIADGDLAESSLLPFDHENVENVATQRRASIGASSWDEVVPNEGLGLNYVSGRRHSSPPSVATWSTDRSHGPNSDVSASKSSLPLPKGLATDQPALAKATSKKPLQRSEDYREARSREDDRHTRQSQSSSADRDRQDWNGESRRRYRQESSADRSSSNNNNRRNSKGERWNDWHGQADSTQYTSRRRSYRSREADSSSSYASRDRNRDRGWESRRS